MPVEQTKSPVENLLSQLGITSSFAQKVRFRGPVGKLALVGVACLLTISVVGGRTSSSSIEGLCVVMAIVCVFFIGGGILWYSHTHPDQATLEGMEVVVYQQQKAWAAKGWPEPDLRTPLVPNPNGETALLDSSSEAERS